MTASFRTASRGAAAIAAMLIAVDPALAGTVAPGPIVGAGAPALALFAAGYYLIRRRRG
jgi:hypothetical protein